MALVPITVETHRDKGWEPRGGYLFSQRNAVSPVVSNELSHLLRFYPLAFAKLADQLTLVSVQSLTDQSNLFVNDTGAWLAPYIPAVYRSYPFVLRAGKSPAGEVSQAVFVSEDNERIVEHPNVDGGQFAFFDEQGRLGPQFARVVQFLTEYQKSREVTVRACAVIERLKLVTPMVTKQLLSDDERGRALNGLMQIDVKRYHALAGEELSELRDSGATHLIHAHLLSLPNFVTLQQLHKNKSTANSAEVVSELFDEKDDTLKFNF